MSPKSRKHREYRFEIDAFTPATIPMARLAEYVSDLAKIFGNNRIEVVRTWDLPLPAAKQINIDYKRDE
ncbi:MAG: hypothetical protein ABR881_23780 [Candidatus Sulfotelmatobacter sp.]|jgi:hypothetical protein